LTFSTFYEFGSFGIEARPRKSLEDANNFLDVRLQVVRMMRIPEKL